MGITRDMSPCLFEASQNCTKNPNLFPNILAEGYEERISIQPLTLATAAYI
jgi:hypothetical protein